jgi:hypothetical protein
MDDDGLVFSLFGVNERVEGGVQMETQVPSLDLDVLSLESSRLHIFLPVCLFVALHFLQNRT